MHGVSLLLPCRDVAERGLVLLYQQLSPAAASNRHRYSQ
jgi:hypothetical protein